MRMISVVRYSSVKYHSQVMYVLTRWKKPTETVCDGQFVWGESLLNRNGGAYKGHLGVNGNHADSVMAQDGLTARRTCRAGAKAEHSDPTFCIRCRGSSTDKSYSGDNRLVSPERPQRRRSSAPRCRLILSWGWRRSQGFGCSPIKKIRELGSDR